VTDSLGLEYPKFRWRLEGRGYFTEPEVLTEREAITWMGHHRSAHATLELRLMIWSDSDGWVVYLGRSPATLGAVPVSG